MALFARAIDIVFDKFSVRFKHCMLHKFNAALNVILALDAQNFKLAIS